MTGKHRRPGPSDMPPERESLQEVTASSDENTRTEVNIQDERVGKHRAGKRNTRDNLTGRFAPWGNEEK